MNIQAILDETAKLAAGYSSTTRYADTMVALGPKGYYRLNGSVANAATVLDSSGNGAHGTMQNVGPTITSVVGLLPSVDPGDNAMAKSSGGAFDRIDLPDVAALNISGTALSLAFICQATTPGAFATLLRKVNVNNGYSLRANGTGGSSGVHLDIGTGSGLVGADLNDATLWDGNLHHGVVTWDGSNARLYRDGALTAGPVALVATMTSPAGRVGKLFNDEGFASTNYVGTKDECAFFNKVLTLTDVQGLYAARLPATPARGSWMGTASAIGQSLGTPIKVAYSLPPEAPSLQNDGLVHFSFWDGMTVDNNTSDLPYYIHRVRMQCMLAVGRSDLPKAYSILTPMLPAYLAAFNGKIKLGLASVAGALVTESPGIVDAIYPNRIALEIVLRVVEKEATAYSP